MQFLPAFLYTQLENICLKSTINNNDVYGRFSSGFIDDFGRTYFRSIVTAVYRFWAPKTKFVRNQKQMFQITCYFAF